MMCFCVYVYKVRMGNVSSTLFFRENLLHVGACTHQHAYRDTHNPPPSLHTHTYTDVLTYSHIHTYSHTHALQFFDMYR